MVQLVGRKNLTLDQSKVGTDVGTARLVVDLRMSDGIITILVGPRVERREVEVVNLFAFLYRVVEFDSVDSSSEERVARLESGDEVKGVDECTDGVIVFLAGFPFAFPQDDHAVPHVKQSVFF